MKKIILTTAAVSFGLMLAAAGTASAQQTRTTTFKPAQAQGVQMKLAPVRGGMGAASNSGPAWTASCYAEFGPNAKYPDAAMLEKCLNW